MIIGICGKSGSGKSTLTKNIMNIYKNCACLEVDKVGHQVMMLANFKEELMNTFGSNVVKNNIVDRKEINRIIFNSKTDMSKYNLMIWKHMKIIIDRFMVDNKNKTIILDWALLPLATDYFNMCDIKILLDAPYETRKERVLKRDNITREEFDLREKGALSYCEEDFDIVLNDNTEELIRKKVKVL